MRNSERYQELYEEGYVEGFMHGYLQSGIEVIARVRLEPKVSTELLLALVPDYNSALASVKEDISVLSDERVEELASESWRVYWKIAEEHARLMLEQMLGERADREKPECSCRIGAGNQGGNRSTTGRFGGFPLSAKVNFCV